MATAAALHFCGPVSYSSERVRALLWSQPQRLRFATSVASSCGGFYPTGINFSCTSRVLRVSCEGGNVDVLEKKEKDKQSFGENDKQLTCVMKFGGSSVASAARMREVADLILSFPQERPVIVLSAMGKTTNKLLLVHIISLLTMCLQLYFLPITTYGQIGFSLGRQEKRLSVAV